MNQDPGWSGRREGGNRVAVRIYLFICLRLGRRFARSLLYPVTLYFFFRRPPERHASRAFLTQVRGRPASTWQVLRHIHTYAATMLDRAFLLTEAFRRFEIRVYGRDQLDALIAGQRGVLLLGAHIGSFEALRVLSGERPDLSVRVIMDRKQTPAATELLHVLNPGIAGNVIDAGGDPAELALAIHAAVQKGALIGLLGDRARPGEATQDAEFFGRPAAFPVAPYLIASLLELPVVLCFGLYCGSNRYDLYFETFAAELKLARTDRVGQLRAWTQRYAARLEHYTRLDPYNWCNLYDFWHHSADRPDVRSDAVAGVSSGT
jgi:predicted LPLAT superfamily acyltransferase